jgi:hypothetical protein
MSADMPAWRYALSDEHMRDLVVLIRKFCTGFAALPPAQVRPLSNPQR